MEEQGLSNSYTKSATYYHTAVKEKGDQETSKDLLQTPSPNRRHVYRPSNIKLIMQHQ